MRKVALVATLMLAACGGGGGGGSAPVQVPVNISPVITTASTLSLVENMVAVTTLSATDADGDPISWSIAGGEDSARFVVNGRQLNFASPPNYDAPADANSDNSYAVIVSASDGKTSVTQALTVTVSNSKEGVVVRQVGSIGEAWVGATQLKDGSIKLVSRTAIYRYDPAARTATQQLRLTAGGQGGRFLSITPDRSALIAPYMLVSTRRSSGQVDVWQVFGGASGDFSFEPEQLGSQPVYSLSFDPTVAEVGGVLGNCISGRACIAFGSVGVPAGVSSTHYGSMVEFVPNPDPYAGASVGPAYLPPVITATGYRLPVAISVDQSDPAVPFGLIIDRGTTRWDEINRVLNTTPPTNFGWPWREGIDEVQAGGPAGLFGPELVIARGDGLRQADGLTSLAFYKGSNSSLGGMVLIGDRSGKLFAVPRTALDNGAPNRAALIENRTLDFQPESGTIDGIVAMLTIGGQVLLLDRDGDLFLLEG